MITELKVVEQSKKNIGATSRGATTKVWQRSGLSRSAELRENAPSIDDRVVQNVGTIGPYWTQRMDHFLIFLGFSILSLRPCIFWWTIFTHTECQTMSVRSIRWTGLCRKCVRESLVFDGKGGSPNGRTEAKSQELSS